MRALISAFPRRVATVSAAAAWLLVLAATCLRGLSAQTQTFRAGIDVIRIDAVVVDAKGMPIRGLKAEDFTVAEDGMPRPIVGFEAIDLPIDRVAEPTEAAWVRSASRDVVTNKVEDRRLFMIVIDDAVMKADPRAIARAKAIGRDVVSRLGANDQAAVVFTQRSGKSQPFTADHARLEAAIDSTGFGKSPREELGEESGAGAFRDVASAWTLAQAAQTLLRAPQTRKTLVLISGGAAFAPATLGPVLSNMGGTNGISGSETATRILDELNRLFAAATNAHANVYAFDVNDFHGVAGSDLTTPERNYLRIVANNTGGRATIANDDPVQGVTQMFRESSVYYLIGFASASGKPGRHRVDVRTTLPGATVLSRTAFEVTAPKAVTTRPASPLASSMAALLPVDSLPMRAAATALPGPTPNAAMVAIALGINQPAEGLDGARERLTAQIDAYQTDGRFSGATKLDVQLVLRPSPSGRAQYELLAKLPLKPRRYQLRIAAHAARANVRGSVFADIDVPDFSRKGVTVAPLVLSSSPSPVAAPSAAFVGLLPVVPTSHRSFGTSDRVSILARIVQGGKSPLVPVSIAATIVDTRNQRVFEQGGTITADSRSSSQSADYTLALPLDTLAAGDYLLSVKATTPDGTDEKTLRFSRR